MQPSLHVYAAKMKAKAYSPLIEHLPALCATQSVEGCICDSVVGVEGTSSMRIAGCQELRIKWLLSSKTKHMLTRWVYLHRRPDPEPRRNQEKYPSQKSRKNS